MRVERNEDGTYKCWMNDDEYEQLQRAATDYGDSLMIRLGAEVGLRSHEIANVRPDHLHRSAVRLDQVPQPVDATWLRVPRGKDTRGAGGKARDAIVPDDVEREFLMFTSNQSLEGDDPLFPNNEGQCVTERTIQRRIKAVAEAAAEDTGNVDFAKVSSHDLRRYYATKMLQDHGMNPEVVMDVGGWGSYEDLKPYLKKPTEDVVVEEFRRAGLV